MAQQESIIKLKGKIGDLTFYKTKTGYQARQVTGVSADRIASEPNYQRTRENNVEFTTAASASKRLRDTFRPVILLNYDPQMPNRLFSRMMRVVKADSVNDRGERQVLPENLGLLNQFAFNTAAPLSNTLFVNPQLVIDRAAGSVEVSIPALTPQYAIASPKGATHFQFNLGVTVVDFDQGEDEHLSMLATAESETSSMKSAFETETLTALLPAASTLPIVVIFGITFYQEVNAKYYPLNNGAFNPIDIIRIDVA